MASKPSRCEARQYSDQMVCHKCGLTWDINDPDEPECPQRGLRDTVRRRLVNRYKQAKGL